VVARWDSATGEAAASGAIDDIVLKPGFHVTRSYSFKAPASSGPRKLFLVTESLKEGKPVFREDEVYLVVAPGAAPSRAEFLGEDTETGGDWKKKYGAAGHAIAGKEAVLSAGLRFSWQAGEVWTWEAATEDARGLVVEGKGRAAAARYGDRVEFTVDAGPAPRKVSLYVVDWDRHGRRQTVEVRRTKGALLDRREVSSFQGGKYLSWTLSGSVRFVVTPAAPPNAVVGGVFFDRAD
jgi:hypothetical protein